MQHYEKQFHLISWCGNFMENHSFRIVSVDSHKTIQKLCFSTKFPYQEITWNYSIFQVVSIFQGSIFKSFKSKSNRFLCVRSSRLHTSFIIVFLEISQRPAALLKKDSNTSIFVWNFRNFLEHLSWQNTSGSCFRCVQFIQNNPSNKELLKRCMLPVCRDFNLCFFLKSCIELVSCSLFNLSSRKLFFFL